MDPLDLYERGSAWTAEKIEGAKDKLDSPTACDEWDARALVNHLLSGREIFVKGAKGEPTGGPPEGPPPELITSDSSKDFEETRRAILEAFRAPGAIEKGAFLLGIAFVDSLVHGWDLAKGTGQDTTMPPDLAEAAFQMMSGRLTDENRGHAFKPEVEVPEDASAQEKLLAYVGRKSS